MRALLISRMPPFPPGSFKPSTEDQLDRLDDLFDCDALLANISSPTLHHSSARRWTVMQPYLRELVHGPHCVKDNMKFAVLCEQNPND